MFTTEGPYRYTHYWEVYHVVYCPVHTHTKGNGKTKLLFCRALRFDARAIQTEREKGGRQGNSTLLPEVSRLISFENY